MHTVGRRWRTRALPKLGVLLAYALLALVLTWPVVSHIGTHVPGNGADDPPLTWNLWWVRYALLELGANPFDCDYLFYPLGINLAFYTLTVLNGLLSIPLQAVFGLVAASNLLLFSSFVLSAYGAYLLAAYLLARNSNPDSRNPTRRSLVAAFGAGLLYAFACSKLSYAALGQWNIASSQWIPFYVLYLFKMWDEPGRWRNAVLVALFFLLQAYAELTYASFLVLFTALWLVWQVLTHRRALAAARLPRFAGGLALVIAISLAGLLPVLLMMVPDLLAEGDIFVEGGGFADVFSADLLGFLVPTMYHPLLGSLVERFSFDHSVGQHIYLGYSALFLAAVGFAAQWRSRASRRSPATAQGRLHAPGFWVLSSVAFWLLSLGPTLRVNGHDTGLPLPFALVAQLPFFKGNRYPSRYSVLLILSLAVLVAYGLAAVLSWWGARPTVSRRPLSRYLAPLLLASLLLFEHLSVPLPLSDMRVPAVYQAIADEIPGDWTLLDLPVAWRNGFRVTGTQDPIIMFEQYYQSVHGKRILAGNTSRNPPLKFQYFAEAPVINTLIALETGHAVDPTLVEADRALAAEVLRFFNIEAVIIHPAQVGPEVIPYVEATMPVKLFRDDGEIRAYRVELPPWPETWTIEPGDPMSQLSFAEGWGIPSDGAIWAQRRAVRLLVPLNGEAQRLAFRAYAPEEGQRLRLEINRQTMQTIEMTAGWNDYQALLPTGTTLPGLNEVWLSFETLYPASEVELSRRSIGHTGIETPINLVVQSAGLEVGDLGHIFVDGRNVSPNERGYNVVVIHPQSGVIEQAAGFDTHLDEGASHALAAFLGDVPPGYIVAVAAADEASRLLGQEAVDALKGIGATGDLRGKFRWGHGIIGVQGAPPGTALEALDWMRPISLAAGEGATEPELAAAFAAITFTTTPDR